MHWLEYLRELNIVSLIFRLLLATLFCQNAIRTATFWQNS